MPHSEKEGYDVFIMNWNTCSKLKKKKQLEAPQLDRLASTWNQHIGVYTCTEQAHILSELLIRQTFK